MDLALFTLFVLWFVLAPGVACYLALASRPGGALQALSIGGGVGHALALAAFIATAALGARPAFFAYPALVLLAAGPRAWRRRPGGDEEPRARSFSRRQVWALCAVALCMLGLYAAGSVSQAPLPEEEASVSLYPDLVWGMSLAAEARHHWPMTTPQVSGEPLRYHTFVFAHMAAASQATGIELATVVLRLVPLALLLLLTLQLAHAGRHLTGRSWAGPLAAGALLVGGDLDMGAGRPEPFLGVFFSGLFLSPTQLLGLVVFVPAVVVIRDIVEPQERGGGAGDLTVLGLLLFACSGAKGAVVPVLLGGLVLLALWCLWRRLPTRPLVGPLALTALALVASYVLLYSGSGSRASSIGPLASSLRSLPGARFESLADDGLLGAIVAYPTATFVTFVGFMPALAGLAWVVRRGRPLSTTQAWLLALLVTSVTAFFTLDLPGTSQLYFLWFGFAAATFASMGGLIEGWEEWRRSGRRAVPAALLAAAVACLLLGLDVDPGDVPLPALYVALSIVLGAILVACVAGLLDASGRQLGIALLAAAVLMGAGLLDGPLDRLPQLARRALDGDAAVHKTASPAGPRGLTPELARGLRWIRESTPSSSVLAVNNHLLFPNGDSRYFYYSALSERRVYLESWDYTDKAVEIGPERVRAGVNPYPLRLAINDSALAAAGRSELAALRRGGATHLLVDRLHGPTPPARSLGAPAYANGALRVYALR